MEMIRLSCGHYINSCKTRLDFSPVRGHSVEWYCQTAILHWWSTVQILQIVNLLQVDNCTHYHIIVSIVIYNFWILPSILCFSKGQHNYLGG